MNDLNLSRNLENHPITEVDSVPKPWEIKPEMGLREQALRSAFSPDRSLPGYKGIPVTKDLIRHLLVGYMEELGDGVEPDEELIGLTSDMLKVE